jgi:hypothetical protein
MVSEAPITRCQSIGGLVLGDKNPVVEGSHPNSLKFASRHMNHANVERLCLEEVVSEAPITPCQGLGDNFGADKALR